MSRPEKSYAESFAAAGRAFDKAKADARKAYYEALAAAQKNYDKARKAAQETYYEAKKR